MCQSCANLPRAPIAVLSGRFRPHRRTSPFAGKTTVATPFAIDGERPSYSSPPPRVGEHSAEVLAEAGFSDEEIAALVHGLSSGLS